MLTQLVDEEEYGMFRFLLCASHVMHKKASAETKYRHRKIERKSIRTFGCDVVFIVSNFQTKQKNNNNHLPSKPMNTMHTYTLRIQTKSTLQIAEKIFVIFVDFVVVIVLFENNHKLS